jgi:hypothetical protein
MADTPKRIGAVLRAVGPQISPALDRVRRGELTVEEYIERRLDAAMAHLDPKLSAEQRERAREVLREHIETDPVLSQQLERLVGPRSNAK